MPQTGIAPNRISPGSPTGDREGSWRLDADPNGIAGQDGGSMQPTPADRHA